MSLERKQPMPKIAKWGASAVGVLAGTAGIYFGGSAAGNIIDGDYAEAAEDAGTAAVATLGAGLFLIAPSAIDAQRLRENSTIDAIGENKTLNAIASELLPNQEEVIVNP